MFRDASTARRFVSVLGGYAAAVGLSWLAVRAYIALTPGVDRQAAAGMTAFGDSMVFLFVLAVVSVPVTGLALYSLRPYRRFWQAALGFALPVSATALMALVGMTSGFGTSSSTWVMLSPIRIILAPVIGLALLLFAIFAPTRRTRLAFLGLLGLEVVAFAAACALWMASAR